MENVNSPCQQCGPSCWPAARRPLFAQKIAPECRWPRIICILLRIDRENATPTPLLLLTARPPSLRLIGDLIQRRGDAVIQFRMDRANCWEQNWLGQSRVRRENGGFIKRGVLRSKTMRHRLGMKGRRISGRMVLIFYARGTFDISEYQTTLLRPFLQITLHVDILVLGRSSSKSFIAH